MGVVPRVGAWIETTNSGLMDIDPSRSYPVWVRGLKLYRQFIIPETDRSYPVWVRGLKRTVHMLFKPMMNSTVVPRVGAWIETNPE